MVTTSNAPSANGSAATSATCARTRATPPACTAWIAATRCASRSTAVTSSAGNRATSGHRNAPRPEPMSSSERGPIPSSIASTCVTRGGPDLRLNLCQRSPAARAAASSAAPSPAAGRWPRRNAHARSA